MSVDLRPAAAVALLLVGAVHHSHAQQPATASLAGLMRDVACAPVAATAKPPTPITVVAGKDPAKTLFGTKDAVIVNAGTAQGVRTGDEFYARRVVADNFTDRQRAGRAPVSIHTAGMIQIVEAQTDVSIGVVTYGCDGVIKGDYLERFEPPALPPGTSSGSPDFTSPGRLILGDDRRQTGSAGEFMVLDRGSDHGVKAGQQVTIFRQTLPGGTGPVSTVGSGTIYAVRPETSIVRIEKSTEAVYVGDLVAIHR